MDLTTADDPLRGFSIDGDDDLDDDLVDEDVTAFLDQHPGGGELLTEFRGRDASLAFDEVGHSFFARAMLDAYVVFAPERFVGGPLPPRRRKRSAGDERKTLLRYGFARSRMRGDG